MSLKNIKAALKLKKKQKENKHKWGDVQFYHQMSHPLCPPHLRKRYTVAIEIPSKRFLLALQNGMFNGERYDHPEIELNIGLSKVNPKDQYTKRIGRELSHERIKKIKFYLNQVIYEGGRALFHISGLVEDYKTTIHLSINPGSSKAQFNLAHLSLMTPKQLRVAKGEPKEPLEPLAPRVHVCGINEDGSEDLR